jgi:hypothetical protein
LYSEKGKALSTTAEKPISEVVGVKVRIAPDLCFPKKALDRPDHLLHRWRAQEERHMWLHINLVVYCCKKVNIGSTWGW